MSARDELERLLAESPDAARERAATAFDAIAGGDAPIVLFGAGGLGKRVAEKLIALGRTPVAFADNDPKRAGTELLGIPIRATADAVARHGADAVFVVTVWRSPASERMSERVDRLRDVGAKHVTSFATLSWKYPEALLPYYAVDLPQRILEEGALIRRAFELLSDEASRLEYVAHLRWRLHLDWAGLPEPRTETEYFAPDIYTLRQDEVFVDCGAYDGDTVRSFLASVPEGFTGRALAFEPDNGTFARLLAWRDGLEPDLRARIDVMRAGAGATRETVSFNDGGGTGSAIGGGTNSIEVVPLDEVALPLKPTILKIDVEGYEPSVLAGARRLIAEEKPVLALCVYHRQKHPWELTLTVAELNPGYRFTLRSYTYDGWDLVLYAVPEHRR